MNIAEIHLSALAITKPIRTDFAEPKTIAGTMRNANCMTA
jgi:hypothetical protein